MSRKPVFWFLLSLISISGILFTFRYFSEAFPIVTLDLRMDRAAALQSARELAEKHHWGPKGYSQAASFGLDSTVQNYVELEAGGSRAFKNLLQEALVSPYTWQVRHFKEGDANESTIRFTPAGKPYGFREKLPENAPGASLPVEVARALAEKTAKEDWGIRLDEYVLAESSQETRPSGRIDHSFVYERPNKKIGEGLYRLQLGVGGDKLTDLTPFIKVPEAFERRYEEMRSANNTIAAFASFAMLILYIVGGCIIGLFFLLRQHWVLWKKPLLWGLLIAFLNLLAGLASLPLSWMNYDTAVSVRVFLTQQILMQLGEFALWTLLLTLTFMAAESLTRKAFPHMIQHWKLWTPETASSLAVLGRTLGGYLIVGFDFAFVVTIYFLTTRHFGWWTPSDVLFQPDVLASYVPWLSPIALSLQAGFWEECLFRAVPLSAAALLGARFGKRKAFLVAAFLLQAIIFGAGHANYPSQPAYARLIELVIPSFVFGSIYLAYGLLPSIISHFVFDVTWFSLPLFVSQAHGAWENQLLVIFLTLTPLWVVLRARLKAGAWRSLQEEHYNRAWKPAPQKVEAAQEPVVQRAEAAFVINARVLLIGGVAGLILWIVGANFKQDAPPLSVNRQTAIRIARETLEKKGVTLSQDWKVLPSVEGGIDEQDRFVWQSSNRQIYHRLIETYLAPPGWNVRFARFKGDVVQRAEEYNIAIVRNGVVDRVQHQLPESTPGASLQEPEARLVAHQALKSTFHLQPEKLKEVSAVASKLPARGDWVFTFSDPQDYPLKEGQARIAVHIASDQVVDAYRFIFVPEEWGRKERSDRHLASMITLCCWSLLGLSLLGAAIVALIQWSRKRFSFSTFLIFFSLQLAQQIFNRFNHWPETQARFSTSEPLANQLLVTIFGGFIGSALGAILFALVLGYLQVLKPKQAAMTPRAGWIRGVSTGLLLAGLTAAFSTMTSPSLSPIFADYSPAGTFLPWLSSAVGSIYPLVIGTVVTLLLFVGIDYFSRGWTTRKVFVMILLMVAGLTLTGIEGIESIRYWLLSGLIFGLLLWAAFVFVLRSCLSVVPLAVGVTMILSAGNQAAYWAFPSAIAGGLLQIAVIALLSHFIFRRLEMN